MSKKDIKVPNIGEFKNVEIIEILIKKDQKIEKKDPLITIESDKSSVEIPSPEKGIITSLYVKVGDKVSEGDKILEIKLEENSLEKEEFDTLNNDDLKLKEINVEKNIGDQNLEIKEFSLKTSASPKVRKFARELGVEIDRVIGSERQGRVTESDVKLFVASRKNKTTKNENKDIERIKLEYSHSEFGTVEVKEIPRVKRLSSKYLINSWTNIPHVTNHDEADITELEEFRTSLTDIYTREKKKNYTIGFYC